MAALGVCQLIDDMAGMALYCHIYTGGEGMEASGGGDVTAVHFDVPCMSLL